MTKFKKGDSVKVRPYRFNYKVVAVLNNCDEHGSTDQKYTVKSSSGDTSIAREVDISSTQVFCKADTGKCTFPKCDCEQPVPVEKQQFTVIPDQPSQKLMAQLALEFVTNISKLGAKERVVIMGILDKEANPLCHHIIPDHADVLKKAVPLNSVPNIPDLKIIDVIRQFDNTQLEITNVKMHKKKITVFVK